jgi:hypothetical protein
MSGGALRRDHSSQRRHPFINLPGLGAHRPQSQELVPDEEHVFEEADGIPLVVGAHALLERCDLRRQGGQVRSLAMGNGGDDRV